MQIDPRQQEADTLVDEWIRQYEACSTHAEKREKVWELVFGVVRGARKQTSQKASDSTQKQTP